MAAETSDITEVEWQFEALASAAVVRWLGEAAPRGFTITPGPVKEVEDTYFDTADWRLHAAGFTCRVRKKSSGAELTLKGMAAIKDGIRSRREVTEALSSPAPAAATGGAAALMRLVTGKRELQPLFSLQQRRTTFRLSDAGGELGEVTVDDTTIPQAGGDPSRITRVEVEVDGATVDRAKPFVDALARETSLRVAKLSKFEAAAASTAAQPTPLAKTLGPATVAATMTTGDVAFAVMRKHFGVFLANEPGTRLGDDIEALHDMRVAARRLRAAMQAFRPWLPPRIEALRTQLGWVAAALGEVRDLDVQLERMAEWRHGMDEAQSHSLDALEALLNSKRDAARVRMLAVLDSRRYDLFVERFAVVLQRGAPASFAPGRLPITASAPVLVAKRYRGFTKLGDAITPASPPEAYHTARIDAKKLRYALEFVGPIYGKPATDFSAQVTAVQDVLGLHQDAEVAVTMLRDLAVAQARRLSAETILTMGAISERYRQHAVELRAQFPKAYKPLKGKAWRELRRTLAAMAPPAETEKRVRASKPATTDGAVTPVSGRLRAQRTPATSASEMPSPTP